MKLHGYPTERYMLRCLIFTVLLKASMVFACPLDDDKSFSDSSALLISATSMDVVQEANRRTITTLGTIKNSSNICFDEVIVEVNYFDSNKMLVDTVTKSLYGTFVPASQEVSFRVLDVAAKNKESYVSQSVRILNAEPRFGGRTKEDGVLKKMVISWGPMLLLVAVWIYFVRKARGKNSPQERTIALFDRQVSLIEEQTKVFERIALFLEHKRHD